MPLLRTKAVTHSGVSAQLLVGSSNVARKISALLALLGCMSMPAHLLSQSSCIDSVDWVSYPVQCFSFRDGSIEVGTVYGGTSPYYYSIDGVTFSTRPVFDFLWPGDYDVTIRDAQGCTFQLLATVAEPEELKVTLTASKTKVDIGETITLKAFYTPSSATISSIEWRPPVLFDDNDALEQTIQMNETTLFAVEVVNDSACTARAQVLVEVNVPNIFVPNVILIGSNQDAYFTVFTDENVHTIRSMQIFSREGGTMFERENFSPNDPLLGWNGRWRGKKVPPGVYTWYIQVTLLNGTILPMTGTVTVLR